LLDISRRKVPLSYRRIMHNEVPQEDLLLAQSNEAAKTLRASLGHEGEIVVGEQQRNVRLFQCLQRQGDIRERLGVDADERVILYVPTWRNAARNGRRLRWRQLLEPQKLAEATNARVLVRAQHVARAENIELPGVKDVSDYPHVEELMSVTDVLITHYSSIVYELDLTGGTSVHYVPDRESYGKEQVTHHDWDKDRNGTVNVKEL